MPNTTDRLIQSSRFVVKFAALINRLFLAAVILGLLFSAIFPAQFSMLMQPGHGSDSTITGLRWELLLGIGMAAATDRLLAALAQIVASAGGGDPFIADNARRLQIIGWALLVLQLVDVFGAIIVKFFPILNSGASAIPFSPGGWLAVLMAFVLSRVFAAGSAMRDELEGTV